MKTLSSRNLIYVSGNTQTSLSVEVHVAHKLIAYTQAEVGHFMHMSMLGSTWGHMSAL